MLKNIKARSFILLLIILYIFMTSIVSAKSIFSDIYEWKFDVSTQISNSPPYYSIYFDKSTKLYYILGSLGTLKTSPDGRKWKDIKINTSNPLMDMAHNKNGYVIVSDYNKTFFSKDTKHWKEIKAGTNYVKLSFMSVAANNNTFIAVDLHGMICKSTDGENWKFDINDKAHFHEGYLKVEYINGKFIVFGTQSVYSSTDGENWVKVNDLNKYKSLEDDDTLSIEVNNKPWTYNSKDYYFDKVEYVNNRYYASRDNFIYISEDGTKWRRIEGATDFATDGTNIISIGPQNFMQMTNDGSNWECINKGNDFSNIRMNCANGKFMFFTKDNKLYSSDDGVNWKINDITINDQSRENGIKAFSSEFFVEGFASNIIWDGEAYYVAADGVLYQSSNGYEWSSMNKLNYENLSINKITLVKNEIFGVCWNEKIVKFNMTKNDWDIILDSPINNQNNLFDCVYNGKQFIAISDKRTAYISENFKDWDTVNIPVSSQAFNQICWNGKQYLLATNNATWISDDGYLWKRCIYDMDKAIWTKKGYIGISSTWFTGNGSIYGSDDGKTWKYDDKYELKNVEDILYNGSTILLCNRYNGIFMTKKIN